MKRLFTILIVVFSIILAGTVHAARWNKKNFIGLWQGIDLYDGSEVLISITVNSARIFDIIWSESYIGSCGGGRGIVKGTGVLEDSVIISEDLTLTCFDGPIVGPMRMEFVFDPLNGTLKVKIVDSQFDPTTLHRVNK